MELGREIGGPAVYRIDGSRSSWRAIATSDVSPGDASPHVLAIVGEDDRVLHVIGELRDSGVQCTILVLRQSDEQRGAAALLDAGADYCLPCDCGADERDAVVRALLRRGEPRNPTSSDILLDDSAKTLSIFGDAFRFGPVAYSVVRHLVMNRERWVSQREIIEIAIATHYRPDSAVARVQIYQIRRVLGPYRSCIRHDGNRGCGYMFSTQDLAADQQSGTFRVAEVAGRGPFSRA
ncbi:MAG: hypothetical protein ABW061_08990 [Polyangiaceae bacterium]